MIENLGDPNISFNPSPEHERVERSAKDRFRNEYVMTPILQSTQAWKLSVEDDQRQYADNSEIDTVKKDLRKCVGGDPNDVVNLSANILRKPGHVDVEDNSIDIEVVKISGLISRILFFCKEMKGLSPHHLPFKEQLKDRTISYIDLLRPDPLPLKMDPRRKLRASTRLA